jgi:sugar/nucleoside kinase (ribokinase family)
MNGHIVVAGLTNIETSAPVEAFPLPYAKVRFVCGGVGDRVGGVGFDVAAMLGHLGARVRLASLIGDD